MTRKLKNGLHVRHEQKVVSGGNVEIAQVFIEQNLNTLRPDIIIESDAKKLLIEIAVTHKVDKSKLHRIRSKGIPALEIRLDLIDALLTREQLKEKLRNDTKSKFWLFHPKQRAAEREYISKVRQAIRKSKQPRPRPNPIKTSQYQPVKFTNATSGFSNAQLDRMAYEFYSKFGRQPSDEEYPRLHSILYGKN